MDSLSGMPGTISDDAKHIRWIRIADHAGCRRYRADVPDGFLIAMLGKEEVDKPGKLLWHISVSHRDKNGQPGRVPNWDELKHAKYQLVPEDVVMVLIFPRKKAPYVNLMDTCLHLWEEENPIDE